MLLSLDTREVGRVTIVRCIRKKLLRVARVNLCGLIARRLLHTRSSIILNLGDVGFIDSSGLGTMVRALANTRQARGELKLCNVPEPVRKILDMTRLTTVFDAHESEEQAVAAFYRAGARAETRVSSESQNSVPRLQCRRFGLPARTARPRRI